MENVPLREYLDQRIEDLERHIDRRFDTLENEIVANRSHRHPGVVTWGALIPVLVAVGGLLAALLR